MGPEEAKAEAGYDVFLSYNSADREVITPLHKRLLECKVSAFRDEAALTPGLPYMTELTEAIQASRAVAVFISGHGLGPYQEVESQLAIDHQINERSRGVAVQVIAVLLPGATKKMVPAMLALNTFVDLRKVHETEERVQILLAVLKAKSPPGSAGSGQRIPVSIFIWAAVLLAAGAGWLYFSRGSKATPLRGQTTLDWKNPKLWSGAQWSTDGQTLVVSGPSPGFLRLEAGTTLTDFEVFFNVAIQANQLPITWAIRSEDGAEMRFRYALPTAGAAGVFSGRIADGAGDHEFCRGSLYQEVFGAGHALYVRATFSGKSAMHHLHLTCPNADPRCDVKHDDLENSTQDVPCALPGKAAKERQFAFLAPPGGSFIVQDFGLAGIE